MNCQQCKQRMYPEDPTKPVLFGDLILRPICETCSKPEEERNKEDLEKRVEVLEEWFAEQPILVTDNRYKQLKEGLGRTQRLVKTLLENLKEHTDKAKRKSKYD